MISHSRGEHGAATRDLFLAFAQPIDVAKVRRDARQHVAESTRDLEPRVAVNEQLSFGARQTIWLASFRLLTARTINRLFLVTFSFDRQAYAPTSLAATN
jgi:hypothetical protein